MYFCDKPEMISWTESPYVWKKINKTIERDLYFQYNLKLGRARVKYSGVWYSWTPAKFDINEISWSYTEKFTYKFKVNSNSVIEKQNYLFLKFENCIII
tara:strand:+ start:110 stop:406 length:297 start_codon:yes stop_codon:yes gene_type:complete